MTGTCTYIGDTANNPTFKPTCCQPAVAGRSYCQEHLHVVYQKGSARPRRHKEMRQVANIRMWESLFNEAVEELISEGVILE